VGLRYVPDDELDLQDSGAADEQRGGRSLHRPALALESPDCPAGQANLCALASLNQRLRIPASECVVRHGLHCRTEPCAPQNPVRHRTLCAMACVAAQSLGVSTLPAACCLLQVAIWPTLHAASWKQATLQDAHRPGASRQG
jgi:hypothetical protein